MKKPLRNDCFALPPGVYWTPVSDALTHLKDRLTPVAEVERTVLTDARGRILAKDVVAPRAHPPYANSAVDGYGISGGSDGPFRLVAGRAAAGVPFDGVVPEGGALRILTGAPVPEGVDRIVLEEDTEIEQDMVHFGRGLKPGANIRPLGEDIAQGDVILRTGRRITVGDLAKLASVGVAEVETYRPLRVAVLSTGSEIVAAGQSAQGHQIFDANRPMLAGLVEAWGLELVDLGQVADDAELVRAAMSRGASQADMIVTTGGASAGDEDHISAALREAGSLETWRIALKPGRPLAMGLWDGVPLFGLPGNPVAAFVCAVLFVRPSAGVLGGGAWHEPDGVLLPAQFSKNKKQGRAEFLRARRRGGGVEVFASEGSGRVSGLSWADGLVALEHDAGPVSPGDLVRYIPFEAFGL